jgi:uncharacterized Ntn-hydrolase superfamily protein
MVMGYSAEAALEEMARSDPYVERRQLALVDADGRTAARTGERNAPWAGHHLGDGYVTLGNGLVDEHVVTSMAESFESNATRDLEDRLVLALEAGHKAGGEANDNTPWHSAAVLTYGTDSFPRVDLRIDEHPRAVAELRRILDLYRQNLDYFLLRPKDPDAARVLRDSSVGHR